MELEPFWNEGRLKFITKRLGEFFLVATAAGFASDFFVKYPLPKRFFILLAIFASIVIGVLISSSNKGE